MSYSTEYSYSEPPVSKSATGGYVQLLDYLIPEELSKNSDDLFRARILSGILLSYVVILLIGSVLFSIFSPVERDYQWVTQGILLIPALLFFSLLMYYKHRARHTFCANTAVAFLVVLVFFGVIISGGPLISPANYVIPIPPLLAFCVVGLRGGLVWAVLVLLIHLLLISLAMKGVHFPFLVDTRSIHINETIDFVIAFTGIMSIGLIYETMTSKLRAERDMQKQRYQFLATHDALTGLPNRVLCHDRLNGALQRSQRTGKDFALLYLDLDGFKPVNDNYGHEAGDTVLKIIAQRLLGQLREVDIVARYGGDEFVVILESLEKWGDIDSIIEKLLVSIRQEIKIGEHSVNVDASVGAALSPRDGRQADALIRAADKSMYRNKGQNRIAVSVSSP